MFSSEQKRKAIETYIRFDHSAADTVRELGYPNRHTLRLWWKDYERRGEAALEAEYRARPRYTETQMREAVGYYLEHGVVRSMSRKGCSPDNSRAEGFFGRLKVEFFYGNDWEGVSVGDRVANVGVSGKPAAFWI